MFDRHEHSFRSAITTSNRQSAWPKRWRKPPSPGSETTRIATIASSTTSISRRRMRWPELSWSGGDPVALSRLPSCRSVVAMTTTYLALRRYRGESGQIGEAAGVVGGVEGRIVGYARIDGSSCTAVDL